MKALVLGAAGAAGGAAGDTTARREPPPLLYGTLGLIGVLAFLQVYSIQAILPLLLRDFSASVVQVGATVGATVLAVALMSPLMGLLSDAVGRKVLIVGGVFFLGVPTALLYGAGSIHAVMVLRFAQGLAVPGITVVTLAYIGEEFEGRAMTRMMSVYVAGTVLGGFLGRFLLGHLSEWADWRSAFALLGLLNMAGAAVVWRTLPASRHFVARRDFSDGLRTLASHLRNRALLSACALGVCVLFSLVGCFTYVNLHLAQAPFGYSCAQLANIFTVYLLGVIITPLAGRLMARLGFRRTIMASVLASAAGVLLSLVPQAAVIILGLAVMSSGVFITQAATISFIATTITQGRSLASGLYYMAYYSGGFAGAWLCGVAYTHAAWPGAVAALLAVQALGLVIVWRWMPRRAKSSPNQSLAASS